MKLQTIQHSKAIEILKETGFLYNDWQHVTWAYAKETYRWIIKHMERQGIDCQSNAPIWAWHSCRYWQGGLTVNEAYSYLGGYRSDYEIIEMDVPDNFVLLSSYSEWCRIFFMEQKDLASLPKLRRYKIFQLEKINFEYDCIQATLPFIDLKWVTDIRPLPYVDWSNENGNETI